MQYLGELGADLHVRRNDQVQVTEVERLDPSAVVISPGPGVPRNAGISVPLIRASVGKWPLLGVCLGHQAIGEAFGGRVVPADRLMHGKTSPVTHDGTGIFHDLPSPLDAMRYHSLVVDPRSVPEVLRVTAWTADGSQEEIMGLVHRSEPVVGVQFHPESIGTPRGKRLLANFLELVA